MKMRINKYLSDVTGISRREIDRMIRNCRISVNSKIAVLGEGVEETDLIEIDGERIGKRKKAYTYLILYKPKGVITSRSDDKGRETVMDLLPQKYGHLRPAGRLDFNTEGLLILTDDGDFLNYLIHPQNRVQKIYIAKVFGKLKEGESERLKKGVVVEGEKLKLDKIREIHYYESRDKSDVEVFISHGKNHEIRNILKAVGHPVITLKRVSIGNLKIFGLKPGEFKLFDKDKFLNEA